MKFTLLPCFQKEIHMLQPFHTGLWISRKQISWNGFAETKCYRHETFWVLLTHPPWTLSPFALPLKTPCLPTSSLTQCHQTWSMLTSRWKMLSVQWYFSYVEWTLSVSGPLVFLPVGLSSFPLFMSQWGCWGFFLPLLCIGCCWKICFCLASSPQPGGGFWNSAVKRELCLRRVKPAFPHHRPTSGSMTVTFIKGTDHLTL